MLQISFLHNQVKAQQLFKNFCGENFGKVYCSCGSGCNPQYTRNVQLLNSKFKGPGLTLISLNQNYGDSNTFSNIVLDGMNSGNTKIKYACQEYAATTQSVSTLSPLASFVPTVAGTGKSCKYSTSAIKINS
uniref:pectate lyase n=1 Tax=Meloidogyne incognita TaxID=6306 RepID=A0A914MQH3_MELIC